MVLASLHSQFWQGPVGQFSMNAEPGSYDVAGLAATALADRLLSGGAAAGVYDVAGLAATLERGFNLDAGPGAYDIIGLAATALAGRLISADPGSYAILGQDAGLLGGFVLVADSGVYGVAGGILDLQPGVGADDGWSNFGFFPLSTAFAIGRSGATPLDGFSRYPNVTIPQGATIDVAYITATEESGTGPFTCETNLYFNAEDDAVAPTSRADHVAKARTTAFAAWDDEPFVVGVPTDSPSIVDVVQEIVNRPTWVSGGAMMLLWDDDAGGDGIYRPASFEHTTYNPLQLHIEYTMPGPGAALLKGSLLVADPGVHTVTGVAAVLLADRLLVADAGLYVLTGADAELIFGTINLTGNITRSLRRGR